MSLRLKFYTLKKATIEEVVAANPAIAECAVFGVTDEIKGEVPLGLVVLKSGFEWSKEINEEIVSAVREKLGPVYAFKHLIHVSRLPKTRSGKILRGTLKKIAHGEPFKVKQINKTQTNKLQTKKKKEKNPLLKNQTPLALKY